MFLYIIRGALLDLLKLLLAVAGHALNTASYLLISFASVIILAHVTMATA